MCDSAPRARGRPARRQLIAAIESVGFPRPTPKRSAWFSLAVAKRKIIFRSMPGSGRRRRRFRMNTPRSVGWAERAGSASRLARIPRGRPGVDSASRLRRRGAASRRGGRQFLCRSSCLHSHNDRLHIPIHESRPCFGRVRIGSEQPEQPGQKEPPGFTRVCIPARPAPWLRRSRRSRIRLADAHCTRQLLAASRRSAIQLSPTSWPSSA